LLSWCDPYGGSDHTLRLWDAETGAPLAVLEGHRDGVWGALAIEGGRLVSWSRDDTLRIWDAATGAPLEVLASPRDWARVEPALADELARLRPTDRAHHHSLHLGYWVAHADGEHAVFNAGRHLRFCRFIPAKAEAAATPSAEVS
jgi:hypothetical protein